MIKLYIDPGTGSMLFTILIGIIGASIYSIRMLIIKLRFKLSGGKAEVGIQRIPIAIYSDNKRYWSIFEPICQELSRRGKEIVYMTSSPDDPALCCDLPRFKAEFIGADNRAFAKLNFLNADILLSTTPGLDVYQWKRSKNVRHYVHIPHASNDITLYRMFGIDYYDAILLSGDYQLQQIRKMEQIRSLPEKELLKVGIPYMDEMEKRSKTAEPVPVHERTVLLAPSWGPSAILSVYGGKIIDVLLKTGYHVIIRPHPQSFSSEKEMLDKLMKEGLMGGEWEIEEYERGGTPWCITYSFMPDELKTILEKCGVSSIRLAGPGAYARTLPREILVKIMNNPTWRREFLEFSYKYDSNPYVCGMGKDNLLA